MARQDRNVRLRENYKRLREAGFSSKEALRYRGAKEANIQAAVRRKALPTISPAAQKAGRSKGWKTHLTPSDKVQHGKLQYTMVAKGETPLYNNRYSYNMRYMTKGKDGYEEKHLILTSDTQLTKDQVRQRVYTEIFEKPANVDHYYPAKPVRSSLEFLGAYYNPTPGVYSK